MNKDTLVVFHKNCTDGQAAAWAAWKCLGDIANYKPMQYGEQLTEEEIKGKLVYILDFSFKPDVIDWLCNMASSVVLLDHHKTARDQLSFFNRNNFTSVIDMDRSGAVIAYEHFFPGNKVPMLVQHVQDRDLWRFEFNNTKFVLNWLNLNPLTIYEFDQANMIFNAHPEKCIEIGRALQKMTDRVVDSVIRNPRVMQFSTTGELTGEVKLPVFNTAAHFTSEACNEFLKRNSEYGVVASYFDTDTARIFSLRSRPSIDCSPIASYYGGGGHAQACGFQVQRFHYLAQA